MDEEYRVILIERGLHTCFMELDIFRLLCWRIPRIDDIHRCLRVSNRSSYYLLIRCGNHDALDTLRLVVRDLILSAIASRTNEDKDNPSELATARACAAKSELIRVCISLLLVMI